MARPDLPFPATKVKERKTNDALPRSTSPPARVNFQVARTKASSTGVRVASKTPACNSKAPQAVPINNDMVHKTSKTFSSLPLHLQRRLGPPHPRHVILKVPLQPCFPSPLFLVPKSSGGKRVIIDLSPLNRHILCPTFRMQDATKLRGCIPQNCFFTSIDLSKAFHHIPIHPRWIGGPRIFTKVITEVLKLLHLQTIHASVYIDDFLLWNTSATTLACQTNTATTLLTNLGLSVNWEKSSLAPLQQITYLGVRWNRETPTQHSQHQQVPLLSFPHLPVAPNDQQENSPAPAGNPQFPGPLPSSRKTPPLPHHPACPIIQDKIVSPCSSPVEGCSNPPGQSSRPILIRSDSTVVSLINKQGSNKSKSVTKALHSLLLHCKTHHWHLTARHIPGHLNSWADSLSRDHPIRAEWELSPRSFSWLPLHNLLQIDLFSHPGNANSQSSTASSRTRRRQLSTPSPRTGTNGKQSTSSLPSLCSHPAFANWKPTQAFFLFFFR